LVIPLDFFLIFVDFYEELLDGGIASEDLSDMALA